MPRTRVTGTVPELNEMSSGVVSTRGLPSEPPWLAAPIGLEDRKLGSAETWTLYIGVECILGKMQK